jgi:acetyl esterase
MAPMAGGNARRMDIGLHRLIDEHLGAYVDDVGKFNADRKAAAVSVARPDVRSPEGLQVARSQRAESTLPPGRTAIERHAEAGGRHVPVRVITPATGEVRGIYLDIHAGGFYMGSAASNDARNARLADTLGLTVVSVDYGLAPESPWPAAPDDCETAAVWVLEQASRQFGTNMTVIGGASAGANLAMATLLRLRDRGLADSVVAAVLQFGAYDLSGQTPGGRLYSDEWFIQAYAGHAADRSVPDISPLYGDLRNLPAALLVVGALDVLLEDNLAMAARLSAAGGEVDVRVYPESGHGFTFHPTAMAEAAIRGIESWVAERMIEK